MKIINSRIYLEKEECAKVLEEVRLSNLKRPWVCAITKLTYTHALRRSEALHLPKKHFNIADQEIFCARAKNGLGLSHKLSEADISLYYSYLESMEQQFGAEWKRGYDKQDLVIVNKRNQVVDIRHTRKALYDAGMKVLGNKVTMHALRHSCAYQLLKNNTNLFLIKEYLGHRQISNTCLYLPALGTTLHSLSSIFEDGSAS